MPTSSPRSEKRKARGCSSRRNLQVHHVIDRSHGGGEEDDHLAVLCATRHRRLRCRGSCEGHLRWEFGAGHGGAPIMTTLGEVILRSTADCESNAPGWEAHEAANADHPNAGRPVAAQRRGMVI